MQLREIQQKYQIRFKKALGQNLLLDDNINRILTEAASLTDKDGVIEVGAGLGALTGRLAEGAGHVLAIEIDRVFMPHLEETFGSEPNIALFRGDVLNHEPSKLVEEYLPGFTSLKMVSNLPYYITTPILFHFWESTVHFSRMIVMVQEEVAQRLVAATGAHDYGVLSLAAQYYAEVDIVHRVPRTCFRPQPKVDSCIVRMRNRAQTAYPGIGRRFLLTLIRTAFSKRRKILRNSVGNSEAFRERKQEVSAAMIAAGIDETRRPQTLTLDEFAGLATELREHVEGAEMLLLGDRADGQ